MGAEEPVQIVTGAPNITEKSIGVKVPVVLDGGRVAGGHDGGAFLRKESGLSRAS